jgi:hypothetical protein
MVQGGSAVLDVYGSAKLRDVNGWYHIVVRMDTTQATGSDRFRLYINGEQQTLTFTHTPDLNEDLQVNKAETHYIGEEGNGNGQFDGSMSHIHFCDGYSYAPTEFGETDSTTGEWKIKTSPSVSYGTNGFFILKDGNSVTDQSGNSNNWTVASGTLTNTEDCPSNVFATWNPLNTQTGTSAVFQNGNTSFAGSTDGAVRFFGSSTLGMTSGKWYMEYKSTTGSNVHATVGVSNVPEEDARNNHYVGQASRAYGYYLNTGQYYNNSSLTNYGNSATSNGDIIGIALDLDNNKLYFSKNGTWQNSGDPTSGSTGTGAISISDRDVWFFQAGVASTTYASVGDANFGNGYFGTTAISSEGTNASGLGKFEYDVPTGYTALCTKGLNE